MRRVPWLLLWSRLALAPVVVALAVAEHPRWIAVAIVVATLTDIFDGVTARRLGVATERLRRADSWVDTAFYLGVLAAVVILFPQVLRLHAVGLVMLLGMEVGRAGFETWKFGRPASYHMWSAKAWGVALAVGLSALFWTSETGWPVGVAIWLGVATDLEGVAASVVLSRSHLDVPSLAHAVRIERSGG